MAATEQFLITLPADMAELVHRKVASGEYATESEVITDSLAFLDHDDEPETDDHAQGLERWLREEVVPIALAVEADPSLCLSSSQLQEELEAERKRHTQEPE